MAAIVWIISALLAACTGGGAGPSPGAPAAPPSPTAQASPTAAVPGHGSEVRTGDAGIDVVIDALLSHSWDRVAPLVEIATVPCAPKRDQIGGPPECPPDSPPGTVVRVFPASQCEGFWVDEQHLKDSLENVSPPGSRLYAVYRQPPRVPDSDVVQPLGDYVIVLAIPSPPGKPSAYSRAIGVKNGRIVRVSFGCAQSPERHLASRGPLDFVLPPP